MADEASDMDSYVRKENAMSLSASHKPHCATHRYGGGPCDCGIDLASSGPAESWAQYANDETRRAQQECEAQKARAIRAENALHLEQLDRARAWTAWAIVGMERDACQKEIARLRGALENIVANPRFNHIRPDTSTADDLCAAIFVAVSKALTPAPDHAKGEQ